MVFYSCGGSNFPQLLVTFLLAHPPILCSLFSSSTISGSTCDTLHTRFHRLISIITISECESLTVTTGKNILGHHQFLQRKKCYKFKKIKSCKMISWVNLPESSISLVFIVVFLWIVQLWIMSKKTFKSISLYIYNICYNICGGGLSVSQTCTLFGTLENHPGPNMSYKWKIKRCF